MPRIATLPPAETDLLCEACGYTLSGLPTDSRCPECGKPISESVGSHRRPPDWEQPGHGAVRRFCATALLAIFRPTYFYRIINTRGPIDAARHFAQILWACCVLLFAVAAVVHFQTSFDPTQYNLSNWTYPAIGGMAIVIYGLLWITNRIAARLTAWEANYRGLRVPQSMALRGLYYHAAHYVPVTLIGVATVLAFRIGLNLHRFQIQDITKYLYVLSAEVVVAAAYLFHTYWIGMRNMMYANA